MEIIGAITGKTDKADISRVMSKPEKFRVELEKFGIFVERQMLRYERHPKVFFTNPPAPLPFPASTGAVIDVEQGQEPIPSETAMEATPEAMIEPDPPEK